MLRVAINGYGRIGRIAHRVILEKHSQEIDPDSIGVDVVSIKPSSSTDIKGWMYLLKYDTSYGPLRGHKLEIQNPKSEISSNIQNQNLQNREDYIGSLVIDEKEIPVFSQKDPNLLPWKDLNVDVVIESTGHFTKEEKLKAHLDAGAKSVVLSAPARPAERGEEGQVPTYVLSVNAKDYRGEKLINNASCTTNCITPVAKVIVDNFGVEKAMMTTIHGYTSDQRLADGGHKDYRRGRAAAENIIPTSTGATIATAQALPELAGVFNGLAIRVPVAVGSLSDFTFLLKRNTTVEEVNEIFRREVLKTEYQGILEVTEDPIVSSDIIGNPHSAIIDLSLTQVVSGNMLKVIAWYDNEYGYCNRLVEEVIMVGRKLT